MNDDEIMGRVRGLIELNTGICLGTKKDLMLSHRLEKRMAASGSLSLKEYYFLLVEKDRYELNNLIDEVTVNETYLFRDFPQLQGFAEKVLPPYLDAKRLKRDYSLKLWSAACSTGEEPYTLSIILHEMIRDYPMWEVGIEATDIDRGVLAACRQGIFCDRSMKDTPVPYRIKYFSKIESGWRVDPVLTRSISFARANLMDRGDMRLRRNYDFVFCRNVLIYFNEDSQRKVVNGFYDALAPGGYLFLGHSESVGRLTAAFTLERMDRFLVYRKPL
jgi:chemotaxis protein methyltransferase CheR